MGLAFLNKKWWHTGSFKNIEKVWLAELKQAELDQIKKEALKRLKEERHYEEIRRMEIEAGYLPKSREQRLDWMYEDRAIKNTSSEEYLLGKPFEELEQQQSEWNQIQRKDSNNVSEKFARVHEDPLFLIKQEERKRREEIMKNPYKMKQIRDQMAGLLKKKHKIRESVEIERKKGRKQDDYRNLTQEQRDNLVQQMQDKADYYKTKRNRDWEQMHQKPSKRGKYVEEVRQSALKSSLSRRIKSKRR